LPKEVNALSGHKGEEMKGRLKEAVGDVTGDKGLQREGNLDQASAATKSAIDDVAKKAKSVINPKK
jgi:uncharacterized protein YjbJ (UPF0337 family)